MYQCCCCGSSFGYPRTRYESRGEYFGFVAWEDTGGCPYCGGWYERLVGDSEPEEVDIIGNNIIEAKATEEKATEAKAIEEKGEHDEIKRGKGRRCI